MVREELCRNGIESSLSQLCLTSPELYSYSRAVAVDVRVCVMSYIFRQQLRKLTNNYFILPQYLTV